MTSAQRTAFVRLLEVLFCDGAGTITADLLFSKQRLVAGLATLTEGNLDFDEWPYRT
jgi:hypothetical protein